MVATNHYDLDIDTTLGGNNASDYVIPSQKAVKTYVDNNSGGGGLPSQTGNAGKFLTTDGTDASWATVTMPTVDQTYDGTSVNAQSGVAINGAKFVRNTATGTNALTVGGTATNQIGATNIGLSSSVTGSNTSTTKSRYSIAIGNGASISDKEYSIAIGGSVQLQDALGGIGAEYKSIAIGGSTTKDKAIQLGYGTNSTENSFFVGLGNNNYQLLNGTNGLIPDARISSNIARTSAIPTVNNATLTITQGGTTKGIFTANASSNVTIDLDADGGSSRNIGEIVASTIPLTDAGLHLLDGSLISGTGAYADFVTYIAGLVSTYPDLFETEANWQTAVTTYGVCGKFVYDSVNNTVRLPKYSNKIYTQDINTTAPVVGNGISLGLTDGTNEFGVINHAIAASSGLRPGTAALNVDTGSSVASTGISTTDKAIGVVTDPDKSGLIAQLSNITTSLDGYYYIVVATSSKTDIQVDIDEIATDLNGKADTDLSNVPNSKGILSESYVNGTSWYRVYSDGWCEQGGVSEASAYSRTITLLQAYKDTNYGGVAINQTGNNTSTYANMFIPVTTSTATIYSFASSSTKVYWQACGYIR